MSKKNYSSILIIGGTSEIGAALCKHLSYNNTQLTITGRSQDKLDRLFSSITGKGHKFFCIDYLSRAQMPHSLFSKEKFDGIILITPRPSSNPDSTPPSDIWRKLFESAFIGPMEVLRQAVLNLKNKGKVIILSGITSKQYYPPLPQFAVLRNMWLAEAKALSIDLAMRGISVNTLSLGGVWTERLAKKIEEESVSCKKSIEEIKQLRTQNVPLRNYANLSEVTHVLKQMLGDFTNHISGQNIILDGGFVSTY